MRGPDAFTVQTDELDRLVGDLQRCEDDLSRLVDDLARELGALHQVWEGLAAEAQRAAQVEWDRGMAAMHRALASLRAAARTAHGNYHAAVEANLAMWGRLR